MNDKTVVHLSAGTVDQGLNGLATDWLSFYYNSNTFNQVPSTDGQHWISEFGNDHGFGTFPALAGGGNLGLGSSPDQQHRLLACKLRRSGNLDQTGTTIKHFDTPTNYMWGMSVQGSWAPTGR